MTVQPLPIHIGKYPFPLSGFAMMATIEAELRKFKLCRFDFVIFFEWQSLVILV